jgi:hypothetical protein
MRKLARALTLVAMLAAMNLAGMTAAHAYPLDPTHDHQVTTQQQPTADAVRLLARERSSIPNLAPVQATSPTRPAQPNGQAGWRAPALGVLVAVLTLLAGVVVVAVQRANRIHRARQTA